METLTSTMADPSNDATNGTTGNSHIPDLPSVEQRNGKYEILDQYHSEKSKIRVASVGAGASGLCLAYKMERMLTPGTWDLTLYEKNEQLGGTWYENTYPGIGCDIPAHLYTFTFDPKTDWSHFYAYGPEILKYFENFADRYNSHRYIKLNTKVLEGRWHNDRGVWIITLEDERTKETWQDWAHIFINGTGILNTWKWPDIDGLHYFQGPLIHSAKWDHSVDFTNKTVGVIGVGSSSVQIVPQLQKIVKKLKVFIRSSTWISPPFAAGVLSKDIRRGEDEKPGQRQYTFTEEDKRQFKDDSAHHLDFRKRMEAEINGLFGLYMQGSDMSNLYRQVILDEMNRRMGDGHEELKAHIIPKWSPGCRRISPGDGYLEALVQPNVEPVFSGIERIVPEGLLTADGKLQKVDILVCATGFSVAFKPGFRVINSQGKTIQEDWGSSVNMYLGLAAPHFPNYFTVVGPGATWSNGTLLPSIETTIEYIINMIDKIQSQGIKSVEVKQDAVDHLMTHMDAFHKHTVFQEECRSWFKDGKETGGIYVWPGPTIHFLKTIKNPRYEDYNYQYKYYDNPFAYLGNGQVKASKNQDVLGLSPYVRDSDHEWFIE